MNLNFQIISHHRHQLGESIVWDKHTSCLYWADLVDQKIYRYHTKMKHTTHWQFNQTVGSFALACSDQSTDGVTSHLLIALRDGIYLFDLESQQLQHFVTPAGEPFEGTRFNDGKVGPDGCFYVGTMDEVYNITQAKLYRIDPSAKATRIKDQFMVSNGLAWSQDTKTMTHACSRLQKIWNYDFDAQTSEISRERVLSKVGDDIGRPDGGAYDTAGGYWSAGVSAGYLNRFLADGSLDQHIKLPMKAPTMPCFGGDNMDTIFITSLTNNHTDQDFVDYPQSGNVIAIQTDYQGVAVPSFRFQG